MFDFLSLVLRLFEEVQEELLVALVLRKELEKVSVFEVGPLHLHSEEFVVLAHEVRSESRALGGSLFLRALDGHFEEIQNVLHIW